MPASEIVYGIFDHLPTNRLGFCQGGPGLTRSVQRAGELMVQGSTAHQHRTVRFALLNGVSPGEELQRQVRGRRGLQSECCVSVPTHNGSRLRNALSRLRMPSVLYRHTGLRVRGGGRCFTAEGVEIVLKCC